MATKKTLSGSHLRGRERSSKESSSSQQKIDFLTAVRDCQAVELEKVLKNPGIDVNIRIRSGMTSVMHAAERGSADCMKVLMKSGADVNLTDFDHRSAFSNAVESGKCECVELLLGAKEGGTASTDSGLFEASGNGALVKSLCESESDVNKTNNVGNSPIMFAAIYGHVVLIKCLVSHGADVNDVNRQSGETPLMMALNKVNLLRPRKNMRRQYYKQPKRDSSCVKALLELGADVNMKDYTARTALFIAAYRECVESVRLLLKANADITTCDTRNVSMLWYEDYENSKMKSECRNILLAVGRKEDEQYMEHFYESLAEDHLGLKYITRQVIRERILSNFPNCNLFYSINQLPLPNVLKSYLLYDML